MLIFSAGHEQVYGWWSSIKKNRKKRPTWARWKDGKTPPENPRSHTRKPSMETAQHTPWTWRNQPWSSKKAYKHLETALHPTTSRPRKTQNTSNEETTETRSPRSSRDENTDFYWGIPGHTTVSFSSLQKKNTQIIFTFFNMSNELCKGFWSCIDVSRS